MRTYITALLLLLLFTNIHCKKDKITDPEQLLQGRWKLEYSSGGITGGRYDPLPGTLYILEFKDSTVQRFAHDTLLLKTSFTITREYNTSSNETVTYIHSNERDLNGVFKVGANNLSITDLNIDGVTSHYSRYKN